MLESLFSFGFVFCRYGFYVEFIIRSVLIQDNFYFSGVKGMMQVSR